jgi:hypothetical protein
MPSLRRPRSCERYVALDHQVVPYSKLLIYTRVRHIEEVAVSWFDAPRMKYDDGLPAQWTVRDNGPARRGRWRDGCDVDSKWQAHSKACIFAVKIYMRNLSVFSFSAVIHGTTSSKGYGCEKTPSHKQPITAHGPDVISVLALSVNASPMCLCSLCEHPQ